MPADKSQLTINQGSLQGRKDMLGYGISYPVLKIGIGCILFSQSERRWRRRAAYNGDNGVPFLFQVSEIWNFFNSRWCQVSIKIVLIVLLIFCHLLFILVWPVIALVRSVQCSFGPGNFLKLLVALRVPIEIL